MTMFAKKNKRDQQGIPQIHIIKSIAIPIAEENKKLKDNLETTHKRKDNLNSLILICQREIKIDYVTIKTG